jgi:hypothetical protein
MQPKRRQDAGSGFELLLDVLARAIALAHLQSTADPSEAERLTKSAPQNTTRRVRKTRPKRR